MSRPAPTPLQDYGVLGPDSVTWKVFSYPTSVTVGFLRTVVSEMFEPFLSASVVDTRAVVTRPEVRYDRTLQYTATIAFGDSASAVRASDVLMRVHSTIVGTEPISGRPYDANDPQAQLWILLTQWHSVLYAYEVFGPGPLTEEEERRYWAECRVAAAFQTIDPETVPRDRADMRAYYERMRPVLACTVGAQQTIDFMLDHLGVLLADGPRWARVLSPLATRVGRRAVVATLPRWLRRIGGLHQSRLLDAALPVLLRPVFRALSRRPALMAGYLETASPHAHPMLAPAILGVPPVEPVTRTPEEAWARAGRPTPREQYAAQLAARAGAPVPERAPVDDGRLIAFG